MEFIENHKNALLYTAAGVGLASLATYWLAYNYVTRYRNLFRDMGMPYVKPTTWLGSWGTYLDGENFFEVEIELVRKHGTLFGLFEGRQPSIMVSEPDLIRQVLIKDHESYIDRRNFVKSRTRALDFGLTALTGQRWKHVRQQITPAFTPNALRRMTPLIMQSVKQLVANVEKKCDLNEDVDIKMNCGCFTMDVIASVAFGIELDSLNNPDNPFVTNAKAAFSNDITKGSMKYFVILVFLFPNLFHLLNKLTTDSSKLMKPFVFFTKITEQEMKRRRDEKIERPDFLQLTMNLEKDPEDSQHKDHVEIDEFGQKWLRNGLTHMEIIGQAVLFFAAGYETTANVLALTLFALSQHPECQEKLFQEIKDSLKGQDPNMDSVQDLKYLEMCINETMRLYCPISRLERTCTRETNLGGYQIPEGVVVLVPANAIHQDPNVWHEPERYDPERFADPDRIPPFGFLPFGLGNRNCIGMRLAYLELKLALVCLVGKLRFSVSPNMEIPIKWKPSALRMNQTSILLRAERR